MELDENDTKQTSNNKPTHLGNNTTPLPLSDLFIRRSPPEGRLRNVRDSLSNHFHL
jgi:hypothetical protein